MPATQAAPSENEALKQQIASNMAQLKLANITNGLARKPLVYVIQCDLDLTIKGKLIAFLPRTTEGKIDVFIEDKTSGYSVTSHYTAKGAKSNTIDHALNGRTFGAYWFDLMRPWQMQLSKHGYIVTAIIE